MLSQGRPLRLLCLTGLTLWSMTAQAANLPVVAARLATPPVHEYDEAPATPDADDPAIWVHPQNPARSLVLGTLKSAGLMVYTLRGHVVQAVAPPNLPTILATDPPTPAGTNPQPPRPCPDSESGEVFGRFNNLDVAYNVPLSSAPGAPRVDVAVVSDRGCDRLRFYAIDPASAESPLTDITADDVPRLYPWRFVQPSPFQPTTLPGGFFANPLDDQDTAYGLALWQQGNELFAFVSQRNRSVVSQVQIVPTLNGKLSYRMVRVFLFTPVFTLPTSPGALTWTPCRENASEDPQPEGIVVDQEQGILYVGFETIGLYKLPLRPDLPLLVLVRHQQLIEPVNSFGQAYWATPDGDEFACVYNPTGTPAPGTIVVPGRRRFGGQRLVADLEGLTLYYGRNGTGYLIASSQGDSTFHVFMRQGNNRYIGAFQVHGVQETDGIDVINVPMGRSFPAGLLVVHDGKAPAPGDTSPINGFAYENSTQWKLLHWEDVANAFPVPLRIDPSGYHPRR